jgi:intracellular septation protein A
MVVEAGQEQAINRGKVFRQIFNREFVLSVIIPIIILAVFSHLNMALPGIILAGTWALAASAIKFARERRVNIYALIVAGFSAIGLIGTIISRNPAFYLVAPLVSDLLLAAVFLGSLLFRRSLIQVFAEYETKDLFSPALQMHPRYAAAWRILTLGWGILILSQALLRAVLLRSVSITVYFTASSLYENISTPLFLVFTLWFPRWYWRELLKSSKHGDHGNIHEDVGAGMETATGE